MKVECFAKKLFLKDGAQILLGGLCAPEAVFDVEKCYKRMEAHRLPIGGIVEIDRTVAEIINEINCAGVYVVGASAALSPAPRHFAENGWRTGGIIGVPGTPSESADSVLEKIADDMYLYSAPGGPGFAAVTSFENALNLSQTAATDSPFAFLDKLQLLAPEGYLCIFDGIGYQANGILAAGTRERRFILSF